MLILMGINYLIAAIIGFTLLISGCIDKNSDTANNSINSSKNNIIASIYNTTASQLPKNTSISKDNSQSINIVLEKPPEEVIGGE